MAEPLPRWAPPVLAVQFLTRVPVPGTSALSTAQVQQGLVRSVAWFPLVGAVVGVATAAVALGMSLLLPTVAAVLLALVVEARLTGCFHEDAVADFCDGIGGGHTPEDVRRIMKDSRIGTYGAVGLGLTLALRAALTVALVDQLSALEAAAAIVAASTFGRLLVVVTMAVVEPAPDAGGLGKDIGSGVRAATCLRAVVAAAPGLCGMALLAPLPLLGALLLAAVFLAWFGALLRRRLGGSTGDCLGTAAYAGQLMLLLTAAAR